MDIVIQELPADGFVQEICWNHDQLRQEVEDQFKASKALTYTKRQIADAKSDKAKLMKLANDLNGKSEEIKQRCLAPYLEFDRQIKEITKIIEDHVCLIDSQLNDLESKQRNRRMNELITYFNEVNFFSWLDFELIKDPKWLDPDIPMYQIMNEINSKLSTISVELSLITQMPQFCSEATKVYKSCLDFFKASNEARRLSRMEKEKAEAERKAKYEEFERTTNMPKPILNHGSIE